MILSKHYQLSTRHSAVIADMMSRFDVRQSCDDLMQAQLLPPRDEEDIVPVDLRSLVQIDLLVR